MGIVKSEQAKSLTLERLMIMLQNVNSEIYGFWLITPFADCTIYITLWNAVVLQSGDARQMSSLGPRRLAVHDQNFLPRKKDVHFFFLRNKLPIARDSRVHPAVVGF